MVTQSTHTHTILTYYILTVCVLLLSVAYTTLPTRAHAQDVGSVQGVASMQIVLTPSIPGPNTQVTARVQDYSLNLDRSIITWKIDGEVVKTGAAEKIFTFTTGPAGSSLTLQVTAGEVGGRTVSTSRLLRQGYVGIIWEADTYTPPLYKGKALHSPGSTVKITALPMLLDARGTPIDPSKLVYTWKNNYYKMANLSGLGKQTVFVTNTKFLQPLDITVTVSDATSEVTALGAIRIPVSQPYILFYEQHPLRGVLYERALTGTFSLSSKEVSVIAEPYHMSAASRDDGELSYEWRVANEPVTSAKGTIILRTEGEGDSKTPVTLAVRHAINLLQSARSVLTVVFDTSVLDNKTPDFFSL